MKRNGGKLLLNIMFKSVIKWNNPISCTLRRKKANEVLQIRLVQCRIKIATSHFVTVFETRIIKEPPQCRKVKVLSKEMSYKVSIQFLIKPRISVSSIIVLFCSTLIFQEYPKYVIQPENNLNHLPFYDRAIFHSHFS